MTLSLGQFLINCSAFSTHHGLILIWFGTNKNQKSLSILSTKTLKVKYCMWRTVLNTDVLRYHLCVKDPVGLFVGCGKLDSSLVDSPSIVRRLVTETWHAIFSCDRTMDQIFILTSENSI